MDRGFTLIEVLIALAVFSILLTVLYSTFFTSHKAVSGLEDELVRLHEARSALDIMAREMESALLSGRATSLEVKDRDVFGKQASEVALTTFSSPLPGLAEVSYRVEEDEGRLSLVKRLSAQWSADAGEAVVIENIDEFAVEARLGTRWIKTWGQGLPEEVRITLALRAGDRNLKLTETVRPKI